VYAPAKPLAGATPPARSLATLVSSPEAREAIARVAYAEAANQGDSGLAGVVYTIINRLADGRWGGSVEAVVNARRQFEPVMRAGGSWRSLPAVSEARQARIDTIINLALEGRLPDPTHGARFFQNPQIVAGRAARGEVSAGLVNFGGAAPSSAGATPARSFDESLRAIARHPGYLPLVEAAVWYVGEDWHGTRAMVDRVVRVLDQQRETSQLVVSPETFLKQVTLEPGAVQKFYEANRREFEIPEQVRVEYVMLSQAALAAQVSVTPQEVRDYFDQNSAQFRGAEERQASHILVRVPAGSDEKAKASARERAAALAEQVKKAPQTFADVARKSSEDPGSAAQGGDLGFFARGTMLKAFDQAVFSMKQGEIAGPIETEAGFHVIRLAGVRGDAGPGFEQVRPKVEEELRRSRASRRFAELAESLTNTVFEQSDTLKPAADQLNQPIQTSGWFSRQGGDMPKGSSDRLLSAVFAEDVLREKRNTAAIEVAPGVLMAARVVENKPAGLRPLAEVAEALEKRLRLQRASELAIDEGRKRLADLRAGKDAGSGWSAPQLLNRQKPGSLPEVAVRQVFRVDASKLPAYAGVEQPGGGYLLLRVSCPPAVVV
jgi:hypothetical protein